MSDNKISVDPPEMGCENMMNYPEHCSSPKWIGQQPPRNGKCKRTLNCADQSEFIRSYHHVLMVSLKTEDKLDEQSLKDHNYLRKEGFSTTTAS